MENEPSINGGVKNYRIIVLFVFANVYLSSILWDFVGVAIITIPDQSLTDDILRYFQPGILGSDRDHSKWSL